MKIAVFGAAGWLGRAVLENLEARHTIRAFDHGPQAWERGKLGDGDWNGGEIVHGDIVDFPTVAQAVEGVEGIVHAAVHFGVDDNDPRPFLVNLKGLWNVLESARRSGVRRVVHIGSCQTVHPHGLFFSAEVRRPDASPYAIGKRLQEEMCRQFHEGYGLPIIVLRADSIVDSRMGLNHLRQALGQEQTKRRNGWVCRHDLAQACRLALEADGIAFDVLHVVGTPEAARTCNVERTKQLLALEFTGNLERYR